LDFKEEASSNASDNNHLGSLKSDRGEANLTASEKEKSEKDSAQNS